MDLVGAAAAGGLLLPVMGAIALTSLFAQGRPVLFRQTRPGLKGKPFAILKFRTMRPPRGDEVQHLTDRQRITRLGRFLRATSLDELPELWNVLRGEMSLVGPRPLLMEYLPKYSSEEGRRHDMRPGITGWAAVNGRHVLKYRERLRLDIWYVDHWSLSLDLKILAMTLVQVLQRSDVAETQDVAKMEFPLSGDAAPSSASHQPGSAANSLGPPPGRAGSTPDDDRCAAARRGGP